METGFFTVCLAGRGQEDYKQSMGRLFTNPERQIKVAHLLRKYNPGEWGGTETAVMRLIEGLRQHAAEPVVYCPRLDCTVANDPFATAGIPVKRFRSVLPVWRISADQRRQSISVGGNLLSFDLIGRLLREKNLSLIHTHTLNRLGGTALTVARLRGIPLVVTIHGGFLDLGQLLIG